MSSITIGIIVVVILIIAIILRMPVAFALMTIGVAGMLWLLPPQAALRFLATDVFSKLNSYPFSVIPMFVLMGYYAAITGMTQRLYGVAYVWLGWLRGGLSVATVMSCAAFAAVCGSSPATAATIGKVALPEMKRYGYDDGLATGCIAAGGNLGPLIPPSGGLIIYALLTEQSIAECLVSGIIPGIILAILLATTVFIISARNPKLAPPGPKTSWSEKLRVLPGLLEAAVLFIFVIGGLFGGLFTPTQAGTAGCVGALLIGLIRRNMTWRDTWDATKEGLRVSCMILFLIIGSVVFGHFLSLSTLTLVLVEWAEQLPVHPMVILAMICIFYLIGGCFIDALGLIVLTIPITFPVVFNLGFHPIWYGVIICILAEAGAITPPVGVNVYVIKGISDVPLEKIFRGIVPFFIAILIHLVLVIAFPITATLLPSMVAK